MFASRQKFIISLLVVVSVAVVFWSGSRVPQLNEKATMGAETNINALGFDTVFIVQPGDGTAKKILYTTVNWVDTNKKGMTFGVIFASCLMTIFSLLRRRAFQSGFANSALGMVIGAPLGVCVNCAAPIATGLAAAGTRIETTLSTMMSSPTMNFIVLGMLFSLFPLYFVAIKLALVVGFILIGIPVITRLFLKKEVAQAAANQASGIFADQSCPIPSIEEIEASDDGWVNSFVWFVKRFAQHFWFIVKNTVPLMLLAGLLGSIIITVLPWDNLADIIPGDSTLTKMLSMMVIGMIGAFLPIPIAFDIVICAVLLTAGMPPRYVMVLLFTLGIYSVYSYFIVSQAISRKTATIMYLAVVGTGVFGGYVANEFAKIDAKNKNDFFIEFFVASDDMVEPKFRFLATEVPADQEVSLAAMDFAPLQTSSVSGESAQIASRPFNPRSPAVASFERRFAEDYGMEVPYEFSLFKMEFPFSLGYGRTVSSGDIDGNDWPDLLFLTEAGVRLFLQSGNAQYAAVSLDLGTVSQLELVNAAIVDIDGDGWNDIYLASYLDGSYVAYSDNGRFNAANVEKLPGPGGEHLSTAVAFGDLDADGDLDIVVGNWSVGWGEGTWISSGEAGNVVLLQDSSRQFSSQPLELPPAIPTTILLTDFDRDKHLDLIIGNDFGAPDYFYRGRGDGTFEVLNKSSGVFPASGYDVMSIASADLDNDLRPEIFIGEISYYEDNDTQYGSKPIEDACLDLEGTDYLDRCLVDAETHVLFTDIKRTQEVMRCSGIEDKRLREECVVLFVARRPLDRGGYSTPEVCSLLPSSWTTTREMCLSSIAPAIEIPEEFWDEAVPQLQQKNVLLFANEENKFDDKALEWGVQKSGWVWNSKFFDADLDGFNDLLVANGDYETNRRRESNYLYMNNAGTGFSNRTDEHGMTSFLANSSYTLIDIDYDGDQDVVIVPINGPVSVFENRMSDNNSIAIELLGDRGVTPAIGAEVQITHGDGARHQMKELQLSGGFVSFDHPVLYFGLGSDEVVSEIKVQWPDGKESLIRGEFAAGRHYQISLD